jgi:hypothetical protein
MTNEASESGREYAPTVSAEDGEVTVPAVGHDATARADTGDVTAAAAPAGAAAAPAEYGVAPGRPLEVARYGPGVPAAPPGGQGGLTAEHVWHPGQPAAPSGRRGQLAGWLLTVVLLGIAGVLFYLRFHHPSFQVTGVTVSRQTPLQCGVDLAGSITTNGAAGTISYEWIFGSAGQPPQRLSQSVLSGERTVDVSIAVDGSGHGSASETVTLQVLSPQRMTASAAVAVSCP